MYAPDVSFHVSTHASLLAKLRTENDDDAWREFHDRYHDLVRGFARRAGLQPTDADDLTQEVLMALRHGMKSFDYDPTRGRFRGYLSTLARRALWKRRRRDGGNERLAASDEMDVAADADLDERFEAEWRQYHLRLALARARMEFSASEMNIFEAAALEERAATDIAAETGLSAGRIYGIKSMVLGRIRELVAAQVAEEG